MSKIPEVNATDLLEILGPEADEIAWDIRRVIETVATYENDALFGGLLTPVIIDAVDRAIMRELEMWRDKTPADVAAEMDRKIAVLTIRIAERKARREREIQALKEVA